jgi:hypothetical protein
MKLFPYEGSSSLMANYGCRPLLIRAASARLIVSMTNLKGTRSLVLKVKHWSLSMFTAMLESREMGKAMPSRY